MLPTVAAHSPNPSERVQAEVGFGPNPKLARAHYGCAADFEYEAALDREITEIEHHAQEVRAEEEMIFEREHGPLVEPADADF